MTDFDPLGDGRERPDLLPLASDGDPSTAWYTENYQDSPELGGLKKGVGLSLALPAPAVATEMVIDSPTPGAHFEVLGPGSGIERQTLAQGTLTGGRQVIPLTRAAASALVRPVDHLARARRQGRLLGGGGGGTTAGCAELAVT